MRPGWVVSSPGALSRVVDTVRTERPHVVLLESDHIDAALLELVSRLLEVDRDMAVVLATFAPTVETAVESLRLGVVDYLALPLEPSELVLALQRVLERKGLAASPDEQRLVRVGRVVRDGRQREGLTLQQLAKRTGLSVSMLSQIERGETAASVVTLFRLSSALRRTVSELLRDV